jgi:pentatricopeptide repeat protein
LELRSMPPLSGRKAYAAMVKSLCLLGMPAEAETALSEMVSRGHRPEAAQFGAVARCYGRVGSPADMERVIASMADAVLSCYSACHARTLAWLKRMRKLRVAVTAKGYNLVLNSCPSLASVVRELGPELPLSTVGLVGRLRSASTTPKAEVEVVRELLASSASVLDRAMEWSEAEAKLNLHGCNLRAGAGAAVGGRWEERAQRYWRRPGKERELGFHRVLIFTSVGDSQRLVEGKIDFYRS